MSKQGTLPPSPKPPFNPMGPPVYVAPSLSPRRSLEVVTLGNSVVTYDPTTGRGTFGHN
jgi:hypothetical protein